MDNCDASLEVPYSSKDLSDVNVAVHTVSRQGIPICRVPSGESNMDGTTGRQAHRVHRVVTSAFWRTFSHEGKISLDW